MSTTKEEYVNRCKAMEPPSRSKAHKEVRNRIRRVFGKGVMASVRVFFG